MLSVHGGHRDGHANRSVTGTYKHTNLAEDTVEILSVARKPNKTLGKTTGVPPKSWMCGASAADRLGAQWVGTIKVPRHDRA